MTMMHLPIFFMLLLFSQGLWAQSFNCVNGGVRIEMDLKTRHAKISKITNQNRYKAYDQTRITKSQGKRFSGQDQSILETGSGLRIEMSFPQKQNHGWGYMYVKATKRMFDLGRCHRTSLKGLSEKISY